MLAVAIPILPDPRKPIVEAPHIVRSRALKRTYMTFARKNKMSNSKGHERRWGLFHLLSATATSHPSSNDDSSKLPSVPSLHESSLLILPIDLAVAVLVVGVEAFKR